MSGPCSKGLSSKETSNKKLLTLMRGLLLVLPLILVGCGGKQGGGQQNDSKPIAKATVLDVSVGDGTFNVRSGSDILLSAKDSDGVDDPILRFEWVVISTTSNNYSLAQLEERLVERTNSTKLFRVPPVTESTTVVFELTVTDADGEQASDTVAVAVSPVGDTDTYLIQGAAGNNLYNQYELVVALDLEPDEVTASGFEILIETLAEWQPRAPQSDCTYGNAGNFCQMLMNSQIITGNWPAGLSYADVMAENVATASFNPHYYIPVPQLDLNEINRHFESVNRDKRLDLHRANSATIKQRFTFVRADNNARLLILNAAGTEDTGVLSLTSSATSAVVIDVDDIKQNKALESLVSAQVYYQLIDPNNDADTLAKWLASRGFNATAASEPDFAHAIYVNNYDLGFGRDMFMRKDECGNVYSYVENYPTLETALQKQSNFATVVMEYSTLNGEQGDTCSNAPKFVKFFAYVPNTTTGARPRMENMNFDGRGEKYLPGVCTACHGGTPFDLIEFSRNLPLNANVAEAVAALTDAERFELADIDATFMPFDLDSFLYTRASDPRYVATSLTLDNFSEEQIQRYSKSNQEAAMRTFNKNVMHTYLTSIAQLDEGDSDGLQRWQAPVELINTWYNTSITDATHLNQLDTANFNGAAVLPGWVGSEDLYHDVFARYCRSCHMQVSNTERSFAVVEQFLGSNDPQTFARIDNEVFRLGRMPLARLTADRFWVNFDGEESAATKLKAHMGVATTPGEPIADFAFDNQRLEETDVRVTADARFAAALARDYEWSMVSDCGSAPLLANGNTAVASFVVDQSPCNYTVTLVTENDFGSDEISKVVVVDKVPEAVSFDASLNDGTYPYTPGDASLTIDIDSFILDRGDNDIFTPMSIIINDPSDDELTPNPALINNNNGTVTLVFPALAGTVQNFDYKVADFNGSRSARGVVSVNVPAIIPQLLAPLGVTSSSVTLGWNVPAGFEADGYNLYRDAAPYDGEYDLVAESIAALGYTDEGLDGNASYRYRVAALLNEVESTRSNTVDVSTVLAVPSGLIATATSSTSISLQWTINPLDPPDGYQLFEDLGVTPVISVANQNYVRSLRTPNTPYIYQVAAVYGDLVSVRSASVQATTPPAPPTNLAQVEASRTTSAIRLRWADNLNGGNPFYYLHCESSSATRDADTFGLAHTLTGLSSNTLYNCRVRTVGAAATSGYSSTVQVRTKVSYNATIKPDIVDALACVGCHVSHTAEFVRDSLANHSCFSSANSANYGSCLGVLSAGAAVMNGLTLPSAEDRTNLTRWRADGAPD